MEENLINNNEPAPVVEKVTLKNVREEKVQSTLEDDAFLNKLVELAIEMSDEERLMAIEFLKRKIEILKKIK